jgi:hypothetical protein
VVCDNDLEWSGNPLDEVSSDGIGHERHVVVGHKEHGKIMLRQAHARLY